MGDRGNIKLTGGAEFPTPVYFYTHWSGYRMKEIVASALERGDGRWCDPSYLGRIIFDELRGDDSGITGFGISATPGDNEYPIVVVDMKQQAVYEEADTRKGFERHTLRSDSIKTPLGFRDFIQKMKPKEQGEHV